MAMVEKTKSEIKNLERKSADFKVPPLPGAKAAKVIVTDEPPSDVEGKGVEEE